MKKLQLIKFKNTKCVINSMLFRMPIKIEKEPTIQGISWFIEKELVRKEVEVFSKALPQ